MPDSATTTETTTLADPEGNHWELTASKPTDITQAVLAANEFNDPPPDGIVFAGFDIEYRLMRTLN